MNSTIVSALGLAVALGFLVAGCASNSQMEVMGNNTYSITRKAVTTFSRGTAELKSEVKDDAAEFCAAKGKQLKVLELTAQPPARTGASAQARIVFQAVDAPEARPEARAVAAAPQPDSVDHLYSDLMKLDDLRQKNILTNEEFQGQKKKVLDKAQ